MGGGPQNISFPYDFSVSPSPLGTDLTGFDWVGAGLRGFGCSVLFVATAGSHKFKY